MINFTNTIEIDVPKDTVFAYISDLEHTPEWNWAITDTEKVTPGPIDVGTRYRQTRKIPRHEVEELEITKLDGTGLIAVAGTLAGMNARLTYEITETPTGSRVSNDVELELSPMLSLATPILRRQVKHAVADNLQDLKVRLES